MFRRKCKHPIEQEKWLRNETIECVGTVNGEPDQHFMVGGYVVRCRKCGTERFIAVG